MASVFNQFRCGIALLIGLRCAGATFASTSESVLGFGAEDIPQFHRVVVNQTSPRTVQLIVEAIETAEGMRRAELVGDLGACGDTHVEPTLRLTLKDRSPQVRAQSARAVAQLGLASLLPELSALYTDPDSAVRRESIVAGELLGDADASSSGLADLDDSVKQAACAHAAIPQAIPKLIDALPSLPTAARVAALESLATRAAGKYWSNVTRYLKGTTSERAASLRAISSMGVPPAELAVTPMLDDPSSVVRRESILAIGQIAPPGNRQRSAIHMLSDSDLAVRCAAADVIAANPTDAAVEVLCQQLSQGSQRLRDASRNALIAIGNASIPAAGKLLVNANDSRKEDGSYILGRLHSRTRLKEHIELLSSSNWETVAQAARSLALIGDASAGPALDSVVDRLPQIERGQNGGSDAGFDAITVAIISAAQLRDASLLPLIQPMIAKLDCPPDVRAAAIYAFGLVGNASDQSDCAELLSIVQNLDEAVPTRLEAVKALGHLRFASADGPLSEMAATEGNLQMRWMAHWAHDRITGRTSQFSLPPLDVSADVSIIDMTDGGDAPQLSGTIGFQGLYLPGSWVPVRLMFRNGHAQALAGSVSFEVGSGDEDARVRIPFSAPGQSSMKLVAYGYFPGKLVSGQNAATIAEWTDSLGTRIARVPIVASPLSTRDGFGPQSNNSKDTIILCLTDPSSDVITPEGDPQNASDLASALGDRIGFGVKAEFLPIKESPRHPAGYDSCRVILLAADPDRLDMAQRDALLNHLREGGELLVCATQVSAGSWLSKYMPVQSLGTREINSIAGTGDGISIPFARSAKIVEASDAAPESEIVLKDSQLIHVASLPIGLGCVVFTSFPVNALDLQNARAQDLWKRILKLSPGSRPTLTTADGASLNQLVGVQTEPISLPLLIISLYVATSLVLHFSLTGVSRPWAFALIVGAGLIGFSGLLLTNVIRAPRHELIGARLIKLSLGSSRGGSQEELLAFAGVEDSSTSFSATLDATIRPFASSERETSEVQELPFAVTRAPVHAMEVKEIWSVQRPIDSTTYLRAVAKFGPSGLKIDLENGFGETLKHSVLVWGSIWSLGEIVQGHSATVPLKQIVGEDLTDQGIVHSDIDSVRSRITLRVLAESRTSLYQRTNEPMLVGWIDKARSSIEIGNGNMTTLAMVQAPISIAQSEAGSYVAIDGAFCSIVPGPGAEPPYDVVRRQWIPGNQPGEWIIGFSPPDKIGVLRPEHVTLTADVSAPTQTITIIRGICPAGKPALDMPGSVFAQWAQPISPHSIGFDCNENDFDANGRVWIRMRVEATSASPSSWFFRNLKMDYAAKVVAGVSQRVEARE